MKIAEIQELNRASSAGALCIFSKRQFKSLTSTCSQLKQCQTTKIDLCAPYLSAFGDEPASHYRILLFFLGE